MVGYSEESQKGQVCTVSYKEAYQSSMMDFHTHDYYEISLILTGDVKSLLRDRSEEGTGSRLVLAAPGTPHWMYLASPSFYSRINLCFRGDMIEDYVPEWQSLVGVFGKNGNIVPLSEEQRDFFRGKLLALGEERNPFRQRLGILDFLSHVLEFSPQTPRGFGEAPPSYILEALTYIEGHYSERIVAGELAWNLGVSRTTLMTSFHKHTGSTLADYITRVRVKMAIKLLRQNIGQEHVAEQVGLGNGSGLIRAFRRCYGMTPRQYMRQGTQSKEQKGDEIPC